MPRFLIRVVGKPTDPWIRDGAEDYLRRLKALAQTDLQEVAEGHGGSATPDIARAAANEATKLLASLPDNAFLIAMDERGKSFSSPDLSAAIERWSEHGQRPLVFVVGGSWGLDASVRARADATLSFGPMTLPHGLARIVLIEQLYRAEMIRAGRAYHK